MDRSSADRRGLATREVGMVHSVRGFSGTVRGFSGTVRARVLILACVAALVPLTNVRAADDAKDLLKTMSDFMAKQQKFSFSYQSTIEVVTPDFQKLQFVSSGTATVDRPDKLRVTRKGGFADIDVVFDGATFSVLGKNLNDYAQIEAKGTIDELTERLADAGVEAPGADLLSANIFDGLIDGVTDAKHIAGAVVNGVDCEYLAFRKPDVDWEIWIADGDRPVPLRYVITSKHVSQAPQYMFELSDFKSGDEVESADFRFSPGSAKKVDLSALVSIDELPSQTAEDAQ
ncbi:DUF2092 domain-containing protein [Mesorhizobium japonicum]|uniref:DUF2092 domain-containing protein n=1 Tax=Mesorhizobium japonicum TaxID=2066070 RepID=UPI001FCACC24|nr:DUF2092 domain-containing protein [Mesorhizobium japonicum]